MCDLECALWVAPFSFRPTNLQNPFSQSDSCCRSRLLWCSTQLCETHSARHSRSNRCESQAPKSIAFGEQRLCYKWEASARHIKKRRKPFTCSECLFHEPSAFCIHTYGVPGFLAGWCMGPRIRWGDLNEKEYRCVGVKITDLGEGRFMKKQKLLGKVGLFFVFFFSHGVGRHTGSGFGFFFEKSR